MTSSAHDSLARRFFDDFVEAFGSFDGATIAARYHAPYLAFHAAGSADVFATSAEIAAYFRRVVDAYYARGCRSCRYEDLRVTPLGAHAAVATVQWELLDADGGSCGSWRESYNLCRVGDRLKAYCSTDHAV
ncbi:hypothetical protein [Rhizobacter sp. LjRoot28]|jgi:hypothetical protein|uniref:hypothetical protein n=1 Tax=Rhizobacter sp. LjRoot28 TaxID=3342309 RepID=UPI003ED04F23